MSDCFKFGLHRVLFSKKKPGLLHTCHVPHNGFYMYFKPACYETCDGHWLTEKQFHKKPLGKHIENSSEQNQLNLVLSFKQCLEQVLY